ncbi:hypothetical protein [Pontiella agarivorans]|uniref:Lipoprotein n=1 Tax=Pontiella agarivorans TaxID=3038953 RepID=A0ABU5MSL1_9BACT|nr:hypothetical protein [Pontiella agarivorans]MDZ8117185.1 hypothetical protein [Pontiella agarivorans]
MRYLFLVVSVLLLAGCAAPEPPAEPVVDPAASMEFLQPGLRPDVLLFPEYMLMEEYELNQHGRIPQTELIGAGLRTKLSLATVRKEYSDVLADKGWSISTMEIDRQAFRLIAQLNDQTVEIRGVQGRGPTEVFILYRSGSAVGDEEF